MSEELYKKCSKPMCKSDMIKDIMNTCRCETWEEAEKIFYEKIVEGEIIPCVN